MSHTSHFCVADFAIRIVKFVFKVVRRNFASIKKRRLTDVHKVYQTQRFVEVVYRVKIRLLVFLHEVQRLGRHNQVVVQPLGILIYVT